MPISLMSRPASMRLGRSRFSLTNFPRAGIPHSVSTLVPGSQHAQTPDSGAGEGPDHLQGAGPVVLQFPMQFHLMMNPAAGMMVETIRVASLNTEIPIRACLPSHHSLRWPRKIGQLFKVYSTD